ncbi:class I SAM-dependent methyltransferase [Reyranella sp.]|uniref:class I SAM-dependent methyltransferase n=1 Tax=Reyranella sp. TaxID=1929291 RepID=UPI003F71011E
MEMGGILGNSLSDYREKWREAPRGSDTDGRIFSTDLLKLPSDRLLSTWDEMAARRYGGEIGWLGPLYLDTFRDRKVIELGSGLGFDGLRFAAHGAHWSFADIVPDNLEVIRRIASLKGLEARVRFHLIDDELSFDALPRDFDAVWVFGSIHHVPFEIARREALNVLRHLKPDGRWMELVYPRERWLREGELPFDRWGQLTDGERTPWAEWHDVEKVRSRLSPASFDVLLDFEFCSHNYRWIDLQRVDRQPLDHQGGAPESSSPEVDLKAERFEKRPGAGWHPFWTRDWSLKCPPGLFAVAATVGLGGAMARLGDDADVAVDLEIHVSDGAVGVGLMDRDGFYLPAAETIVEVSPDSRLVTLRAVRMRKPAVVVFRNLRADRRSKFLVKSAKLRKAS